MGQQAQVVAFQSREQGALQQIQILWSEHH
jgi:hypothetical protein